MSDFCRCSCHDDLGYRPPVLRPNRAECDPCSKGIHLPQGIKEVPK